MLDILRSVVGGYGPLIVEHKGKLYIEHCAVIGEHNIFHMISKLEHIEYSNIIQTTDRSFELI